MDVAERIQGAGASLTASERRVASVVLERPQLVGFGTVAELANAAGTGAATVVRLAAKLGYSGFREMQDAVQSDLARQLRPAAERIKEQGRERPLDLARATEAANVTTTLDAVDAGELAALVALLSDPDRRVLVVAGDASCGVARQFSGDLHALRQDVWRLDGNEVGRWRELALSPAGTVMVAIDLRRYDRWVLDVVRAVTERDIVVAALTDSVLSPLAEHAKFTFVLAAASAGPFDSHVGTLALLNTIVAGVADELRPVASVRLERVERAWSRSGALTDR